ncbi:YkgJ family cysteine cluster protein [Methanosarcina mazei]|uniref:YkgJ family cysteine cluster protein n=1 Tax=Methanosarcina mazei TaxID=2209 RepID=UPI003C784D88
MTSNSLCDNFYNELNKIVRNYTCPSSCDSICCKYSPINFEKDEYYRIISVVDQISKDIIKEKTIEYSKRGYYRKLPAAEACPLLHDTKCSIYENRPLVCQRFPIEMADSDVIIRPCSLGIDIILDYMCFSGNTSEAKVIYNEWLKNQNDTVPVTAYRTELRLPDITKLRMFRKYIKNTSPAERKKRREGIIEQIKESSNIDSEKYKIPRTEACF